MTPNRPQSSMSQSSTGPSQSQPRSRPVATPRKQRPYSIAVTGITLTDQPVKSPATGERPPLPKVNVTKKSITPKVETKKFPSDNNKSTPKVVCMMTLIYIYIIATCILTPSHFFFFFVIIEILQLVTRSFTRYFFFFTTITVHFLVTIRKSKITNYKNSLL